LTEKLNLNFPQCKASCLHSTMTEETDEKIQNTQKTPSPDLQAGPPRPAAPPPATLTLKMASKGGNNHSPGPSNFSSQMNSAKSSAASGRRGVSPLTSKVTASIMAPPSFEPQASSEAFAPLLSAPIHQRYTHGEAKMPAPTTGPALSPKYTAKGRLSLLDSTTEDLDQLPPLQEQNSKPATGSNGRGYAPISTKQLTASIMAPPVSLEPHISGEAFPLPPTSTASMQIYGLKEPPKSAPPPAPPLTVNDKEGIPATDPLKPAARKRSPVHSTTGTPPGRGNGIKASILAPPCPEPQVSDGMYSCVNSATSNVSKCSKPPNSTASYQLGDSATENSTLSDRKPHASSSYTNTVKDYASSRSQSPNPDYEKSRVRTPMFTAETNLVATARKPATKSSSPPPIYESNFKSDPRISPVGTLIVANAKSNSPPPSEFVAAHRRLATKGKSPPPPSDTVVTARANAPHRYASKDKSPAPPNGSNAMKRPPPVQDSDTIKKHAVHLVLNDEKGCNHDVSGSASSMPVRRRGVDLDERFVSLVGPGHHDEHEDQEKNKDGATENSLQDRVPGAFAISRESVVSTGTGGSFSTIPGSNAVKIAESNPFQVEAMLVPEGNEYLDPPDVESIRRQILNDAVKADAVDVTKIMRKRRCRISVVLLMVVGLVVGLSVGLSRQSGSGSIVVIEQSVVPTVMASDSPSAAPTIFTIAQCSPYVFVEDVELYLDGFVGVVQDLNDHGVNITLEDMDTCAPQSLSAFNIAVDRYNENITLNSYVPSGGNGGLGGNNLDDGVPGPPTLPPQNRPKLLTTLDSEVLLFRYALGVLFFSTGGENWESNTNWLIGASADYCDDWYGIRCEFGGALLNIDLSGNDLQGTIPTEIALFVDLGKYFCVFSLPHVPRLSPLSSLWLIIQRG
jgi:hypothetical protein